MNISHPALMLMLAVAGGTIYAQAPLGVQESPPPGAAPATGTAPAPGGAPAPAAAAPVTTASSLLQSPLSVVQTALNGLKTDRWKKGSVREEAEGNVQSLLKDMQTNLPPLMTAADASPGQLSKAIPLIKHLDAFYDVLLRVEEAARVVAPGEQVDDLQQAMLKLNQARLALDDHLAANAVAQEKQVGDLQVALKTARADLQAKAAVVATPVPCKPVTPPKKKPAAKKPATGTTPATTTPPTNTPAKPSATPAKPATGQPKPQ